MARRTSIYYLAHWEHMSHHNLLPVWSGHQCVQHLLPWLPASGRKETTQKSQGATAARQKQNFPSHSAWHSPTGNSAPGLQRRTSCTGGHQAWMQTVESGRAAKNRKPPLQCQGGRRCHSWWQHHQLTAPRRQKDEAGTALLCSQRFPTAALIKDLRLMLTEKFESPRLSSTYRENEPCLWALFRQVRKSWNKKGQEERERVFPDHRTAFWEIPGLNLLCQGTSQLLSATCLASPMFPGAL